MELNPICPTTGEHCVVRKAFNDINISHTLTVSAKRSVLREIAPSITQTVEQRLTAERQSFVDIGERLCTVQDCGIQAVAAVLAIEAVAVENVAKEFKDYPSSFIGHN